MFVNANDDALREPREERIPFCCARHDRALQASCRLERRRANRERQVRISPCNNAHCASNSKGCGKIFFSLQVPVVAPTPVHWNWPSPSVIRRLSSRFCFLLIMSKSASTE